MNSKENEKTCQQTGHYYINTGLIIVVRCTTILNFRFYIFRVLFHTVRSLITSLLGLVLKSHNKPEFQ